MEEGRERGGRWETRAREMGERVGDGREFAPVNTIILVCSHSHHKNTCAITSHNWCILFLLTCAYCHSLSGLDHGIFPNKLDKYILRILGRIHQPQYELPGHQTQPWHVSSLWIFYPGSWCSEKFQESSRA